MAHNESLAAAGVEVPEDAANELIRELGAGLPEPEQVVVRFPSTLVMDATKTQKTERQVARLLALAAAVDGPSAMSAGDQERVAGLVPLVARRARAWKRIATELQEQAAATLLQSERVRKIADDLSEVALRVAQSREKSSRGSGGG